MIIWRAAISHESEYCCTRRRYARDLSIRGLSANTWNGVIYLRVNPSRPWKYLREKATYVAPVLDSAEIFARDTSIAERSRAISRCDDTEIAHTEAIDRKKRASPDNNRNIHNRVKISSATQAFYCRYLTCQRAQYVFIVRLLVITQEQWSHQPCVLSGDDEPRWWQYAPWRVHPEL